MRRQDWPEILAGMIETYRHEPFSWGEHDCAMWAASVIKAMTDIDPAVEFRNTYSTAGDAFHILEHHGGLLHVVDKMFPRIESVLTARRGDITAMLGEFGPTLGVCIGHQCAYPGKQGLVFHPLRNCIAAWRV